MADDALKSTLTEMDEFLKKLGLTREQIQDIENKLTNTIGKNKALSNLSNDVNKARSSFEGLSTSLTPIRNFLSAPADNGLEQAFKQIGVAIYNTTNAAQNYTQSFAQAFSGTGVDKVVGGIDEATRMSREFNSETIKIGSEFGLSFKDVQSKYHDYTAAVMQAQNFTYKNREEIEQQTQALAKAGIGLDELSKMFGVAGSKQTMLSEGFLLAADSGLESTQVFNMMATATRKMGLSVEDSGKPLLALESLAKSAGLPMTELSNKIFSLAEDNARFGTTVENLSPIVRRFANVLGDGFKGFAIKDTERLIQGLASQVNTTNAAFMAMQSGMTRPSSGVAGAMLDYEDAMAKPEEAMKMLSASLSNIAGGKILTMKDAHASEAAAVQFKIQRDMLTQLTGINDPQQTKTLLALLAEQQSGKQLSAQENKTLEDAMKSGANKQDEQHTLAERMGKAQVGLLAQIALSLSTRVENKFDPQTQAAVISGGQKFIQGKKNQIDGPISENLSDIMNKSVAAADKFFKEYAPDVKTNIEKKAQQMGSFINENKNNILQTPEISTFKGISPTINIPSPIASRPAPVFDRGIASPEKTSETVATTATTYPAGEKEVPHVVVTFRGTDNLTRAIAEAASQSYNRTLHGNG